MIFWEVQSLDTWKCDHLRIEHRIPIRLLFRQQEPYAHQRT
jgi:hypothetical protein